MTSLTLPNKAHALATSEAIFHDKNVAQAIPST